MMYCAYLYGRTPTPTTRILTSSTCPFTSLPFRQSKSNFFSYGMTPVFCTPDRCTSSHRLESPLASWSTRCFVHFPLIPSRFMISLQAHCDTSLPGVGFCCPSSLLDFSCLLIATSSLHVHNTILWYAGLCVASTMEYAPSLLAAPSQLMRKPRFSFATCFSLWRARRNQNTIWQLDETLIFTLGEG